MPVWHRVIVVKIFTISVVGNLKKMRLEVHRYLEILLTVIHVNSKKAESKCLVNNE